MSLLGRGVFQSSLHRHMIARRYFVEIQYKLLMLGQLEFEEWNEVYPISGHKARMLFGRCN